MLDFKRKHDHLVGIDSDGCAFDTMEVKHKECFIPNTINFYNLQGISKFAREAAEFVNLYSKSRGINRFPALVETFQWLARRPEVKARGIEIRVPRGLQEWIGRESKLGNPVLRAAVEETGDADLKLAYEWSEAVNQTIAGLVRGVPPFPYVPESLKKFQGRADLVVVSATPTEALRREWREHELEQYVSAIGGQEVGTKKEMLAPAADYPSRHTLMIGDAPGDYNAAKANGTLFFPINPGAEDMSWKRLVDEGIDRFIDGTFAGKYEAELLAEFDARLPEKPPWPVDD